ncbi:DUF3298 and DUF4163 domain-containing protein [Paenibacillus sp. HB172176]|uniref:DUF3298 and DUF4163 domain-containing protein n=1 Tax=Paenibacillus sp. HB172176 TaxID=2493690 RepID=UPI00143B4D43|nr:DUF3298 and DUF4163 domain-containing protein [Paenibacillus sp. HB172176]
MDNSIDRLKEEYKQIDIPEELDFIVRKALNNPSKKRARARWLTAVCSVLLIFLIGININSKVAEAFGRIPGMSGIVEVLTFKSYTFQDDRYHAEIKVPSVSGLNDAELEQLLNSKYVKEGKTLYSEFQADIDELKQKSGGHLSISSDYEVKTDNDQIFSLARYVVVSMASSSDTVQIDTIDKQNHILLSLPMLFKDNRYIDAISQNIKDQMKARMEADPNLVYWLESDADLHIDGFKAIDPNQSFYINDKHQLVIVFNKYEITPGFMGIIEFTIPAIAIGDLLVSDYYVR